MSSPNRWTTVVAKKIVMAVTGLAMCVFLVGHLAGNLQLLWSSNQFNGYAHFLTAQPVIILIELGLLAIFALHIIDALVLLRGNYAARPEPYYRKDWAQAKSDRSRKTVSSTFMMWSGTAILLFVAFHVWHFKYHHGLTEAGRAIHVASDSVLVGATAGGGTAAGGSAQSAAQEQYDLARLVTSEFHNPLIAGIYVLAMVLLGMHLYHAVSSAFNTIGANHPRYTVGILWFGRIFTVVICGGFAMLPLAAYLHLFGVGK